MEHVTFGKHVIIDSFAFIVASAQCPVHIGDYVHIASFVSITGGPVTLEDFTNVGAGSRLIAGSDDFHASLIGPTVPAEFRKVNRRGITLERHATLGANCIVFPGVTIPEGAAFGAGATVASSADVDPWTIYRGDGRWTQPRNREKVLELETSLQLSEFFAENDR